MEQSESTVNWIGAYLEWTDACGWAFGPGPLARRGIGEADVEAGEDFAAAYLDWMDAVPWLSSPRCFVTAAAVEAAGMDDDASGMDVFREALMAALHTESDCIRFLRRFLDLGDTTPGTVRYVVEAMEHAERLLEDERRAWRALTTLGRRDPTQTYTAWRSDFETNWPRALEEVAADVRALTGTVLALQSH